MAGGYVSLRAPAACLLVVCAVWGAAGCKDGKTDFDAPVEVAGERVRPETLRKGEFLYMRWCAGCHGRQGRGDGSRIELGQTPPPDFTQRAFRHAPTPAGTLPPDDYLRGVVRRGIPGTGMEAVPVPAEDLPAVITYVKYLATHGPPH